MPARVRLTLIVAAALVLCGALTFALTYDAGDGGAAHGSELQGALQPPGIPPRDFTLRDQDGERVRLAELRGEPVVVTFLYTTCEDTCPTTAQQIKLALDELGRDVPVVAVSVDPANDTPLNAKRFLREQRLTGRMRFLLGSRAELEPIWRAYGIQPQGEAFDHTAYVLVLGADGRQRVGWPVEKLTPEGLAHDLRLVASGAA